MRLISDQFYLRYLCRDEGRMMEIQSTQISSEKETKQSVTLFDEPLLAKYYQKGPI